MKILLIFRLIFWILNRICFSDVSSGGCQLGKNFSNWLGTGNREQGIGNREQETGNRGIMFIKVVARN